MPLGGAPVSYIHKRRRGECGRRACRLSKKKGCFGSKVASEGGCAVCGVLQDTGAQRMLTYAGVEHAKHRILQHTSAYVCIRSVEHARPSFQLPYSKKRMSPGKKKGGVVGEEVTSRGILELLA